MCTCIDDYFDLPNCTIVLVQEPWPMKYLAVPQDSAVEINCTANLGDNSFWAIDPGNDSRAVQYQFGRNGNDVLNRLGVYELPRVEMLGTTTLRLLINDTSAVNNQTKVFCHINAQAALSSTLFIFGKLISTDIATNLIVSILFLDQSNLKMSIQDVSLGGINITWSGAAVDVAQIFTLHIVSGSESLYSESLYESYYFFTAPEVAPRCEVYNFSVTATYVGATYIGASCSVSSPVLTMMLPSLPDIEGLERSLKHCVVQHSRDVVLNISFKVIIKRYF